MNLPAAQYLMFDVKGSFFEASFVSAMKIYGERNFDVKKNYDIS